MAKPNSDTAQLLASPRSSQPGRGSQFDRLLAWFVCHKFDSTRDGCLVEDVHYIIRKYLLPIWSEHNYIFSHRIVHWVYNYMFRPCILAIVRLYCKLKQLYNMCMGYCGGNEISFYISGWHGFGPLRTGVTFQEQTLTQSY